MSSVKSCSAPLTKAGLCLAVQKKYGIIVLEVNSIHMTTFYFVCFTVQGNNMTCWMTCQCTETFEMSEVHTFSAAFISINAEFKYSVFSNYHKNVSVIPPDGLYRDVCFKCSTDPFTH